MRDQPGMVDMSASSLMDMCCRLVGVVVDEVTGPPSSSLLLLLLLTVEDRGRSWMLGWLENGLNDDEEDDVSR